MSGRADIGGVRADLITTVHSGHSSITARKQYIDDNSLKETIPANIFRAGVSADDAAALIASSDAKRRPYYAKAGGFQEGHPVQLALLGSKRDFIENNSSGPSLLNATCPVIGCQSTLHFPSDMLNHISKVHGGRNGKGEVLCPSCGKQMNLQQFYKHIRPGSAFCKGDTSKNPLCGLSTPRQTGKSVPPGVFPCKCTNGKCTMVYASYDSLKGHMGRCKEKPTASKRKLEDTFEEPEPVASLPSKKQHSIPRNSYPAVTDVGALDEFDIDDDELLALNELLPLDPLDPLAFNDIGPVASI